MPSNSDVKLVPGQVKIEAWDLCIDSQDRRKTNTPLRRAFVHNFDDGLTVNWDYDYPGGVTIHHLKQIHARGKTMTSPDATHLTITGNTKVEGNLEVEGTVRFTRGVEVAGDVKLSQTVMTPVRQPDGHSVSIPVRTEFQLLAEITRLRTEVAELTKKLASTQANWRWCSKCQGLFFAGTPAKGVCPAGGPHSDQGSGQYSMLAV